MKCQNGCNFTSGLPVEFCYDITSPFDTCTRMYSIHIRPIFLEKRLKLRPFVHIHKLEVGLKQAGKKRGLGMMNYSSRCRLFKVCSFFATAL